MCQVVGLVNVSAKCQLDVLDVLDKAGTEVVLREMEIR